MLADSSVMHTGGWPYWVWNSPFTQTVTPHTPNAVFSTRKYTTKRHQHLVKKAIAHASNYAALLAERIHGSNACSWTVNQWGDCQECLLPTPTETKK